MSWGWYNLMSRTKNFTLQSLLHHTTLSERLVFCGKDLHKLILSISLTGLTLLAFHIFEHPLFILKRENGNEAPDHLLTILQSVAWLVMALLILFYYLFKFPRATNTFVAQFWSLLFCKKNNHPVRREFSPWEQKKICVSFPAVSWNRAISCLFFLIRSKEGN